MNRNSNKTAVTASRCIRLPFGNGGELTVELIASENSLLSLRRVTGSEQVKSETEVTVAISSLLDQVEQQLRAYLAGNLKSFDVACEPQGTPFQQRVWQEIANIPYGEVISYKELARRAGNPRAIRAAAAACGANPIPVIVPCHRVVASDGSLHGFAWGLPIKEFLLTLEDAEPLRHAA